MSFRRCVEYATGLSLITRTKDRNPSATKSATDPIFGSKYDYLDDIVKLGNNNDYIKATQAEWLVFFAEYCGRLPTEICKKNLFIDNLGKKTYAKSHIKDDITKKLQKRYFGKVSRNNNPFVSSLEFLQTIGIIGRGKYLDNFAYQALGDDYKDKIPTVILSAFDGYSGACREGIGKLCKCDVYDKIRPEIIEQARVGVPPNVPVIKIPTIKQKNKNYIKRAFANHNINLDDSYDTIVRLISGFSNDAKFTDPTHTYYRLPMFFPGDIDGLNIETPIAINIESETYEVSSSSRMSRDMIMKIFRNCNYLPFDLPPSNVKYKNQFLLSILEMHHPHLEPIYSLKQAEEEANISTFKRGEYEKYGDFKCDIEHFIPRALLREHGLPVHDVNWCFFMSRKNHQKLFSGLNTIEGVGRKKRIAIEQDWWTEPEANKHCHQMVLAVRRYEQEYGLSNSFSSELINILDLDSEYVDNEIEKEQTTMERIGY